MQTKNDAVPMEASDVSNQAGQPTNEVTPVELSEEALENVSGGIQAGCFLKPSSDENDEFPKPKPQLEIGSIPPPQAWL